MEFEKRHIVGIIAALLILIADIVLFRDDKIFFFLIGITITIASAPFVISIILATGKERENDEMFLEFARDLVESVKAGTPISKSIINVRNKNYGSLNPYIKKLANQISLGIPVKEALNIFARDVNSKTVSRSIALISEAERAGGNIEKILESIAVSVGETEKLKKERKAAIYSLVVQSYIIFIVFIIIMLILQFKILPMIPGISGGGESIEEPFPGIPIASTQDIEDFSRAFLFLLIAQAVFTGLVTGKLSEGSLRAGIKHSFFLVIISILSSTGSQLFFS